MTRAEITKIARNALSKMEPGQRVTIPLPAHQPGRRILYQAVNGIAYAQWGAGWYRIWGPPGAGVTVIRLKERRHVVSRRNAAEARPGGRMAEINAACDAALGEMGRDGPTEG